jgi:hypothetical protein
MQLSPPLGDDPSPASHALGSSVGSGVHEERTMAGLKDKRGFIDKDRLDLSERKAVEYWMKRWGVTKDQITSAHRKVGRMTKDIAAELGKKR